MSNDDTEPTKEELQQRVEQLEDKVQKMLPNRRQMLKGMATAGAAGALGFGAGSATASPGDDGETVWGGPNNRDSYYANEIDVLELFANSLTADQLDISGEVLASVEKTTDQSYSSANGWVTVTWDNEVTDVTSDFDLANDKFQPPEDGHYLFLLTITHNSYSDQDNVYCGVRVVGNSNPERRRTLDPSGTGDNTITYAISMDLSSTNEYEIVFNNFSGDDTISGNAKGTNCQIIRQEEA